MRKMLEQNNNSEYHPIRIGFVERLKRNFTKSHSSIYTYIIILLTLLLITSTFFMNFWLTLVIAIFTVLTALLNYYAHKNFLVAPVLEASKAVEALTDGEKILSIKLAESFPEIKPLHLAIENFVNKAILELRSKIEDTEFLRTHLSSSSHTTKEMNKKINLVTFTINALFARIDTSKQNFENFSSIITNFNNIVNSVINELETMENIIISLSRQIEIIALNANIEAAKAGKFGRGFEIIALSLQKLSSQMAKTSIQTIELKPILKKSKSLVAKNFAKNTALFSETIEIYNKKLSTLETMLQDSTEIAKKFFILNEELENFKNRAYPEKILNS